jgi:hypothetical protein
MEEEKGGFIVTTIAMGLVLLLVSFGVGLGFWAYLSVLNFIIP